jgi:hypothetical protein
MTSDNNLCLILRRLDEIERKLDHILEELRTPTAIGYSVRRGSFPSQGLIPGQASDIQYIMAASSALRLSLPDRNTSKVANVNVNRTITIRAIAT